MQPKAPAGGYQNGGWYEGRQYWNGQFGAPGVIINPNQQGSGQAVSAEVNQQSSVAQGKAPNAIQSYLNGGPATGGDAAGGGGGIGAASGSGRPKINVQSIYDTAYKTPEIDKATQAIQAKQAEIEQVKRDAAAEAAKINDNPWYAEAERTGKLKKLDDQAQQKLGNLNGEYTNLQGNLSTLRADAETKVNVALKQYDIDSQAYNDALSQLSTLISTGALAGANSQDIASLASQTGISTNMLSSLAKSAGAQNTYLTTATDNNGNVTVLAIDKTTGEVLNTSTVGGVGKGSKGGASGSTAKEIKAQFVSDTAASKPMNVNGVTVGQFPQLVQKYAPFMSLQDIYKNYATTDLGKKWGSPKESADFINAIYTQARKGTPADSGVQY